MPKAIHSFPSLAVPPVAIDQTDKQSSHFGSYEFVSVALFSIVGFLISLVAIILGMKIGWY
ncbi:hypothetical protein [Bradyrhizobium sp. Tv2a-2]|uniref:hypothetical protein n=1 Tax=Bradyrhizobium sp. Tv2a-2 TaxID=113395 RepID=UPI000411C7EE|nr:hypothetical protein [Bradyrhizobium sp. Tv2a-2]